MKILRNFMTLDIFELENGVKKIDLKGRMDIFGTQDIETKFTAVTASEAAKVIVDLSGVDFMASIGIGVIVRAVNALFLRGGKLVMLNPQDNVCDALEMTMITKVAPITYDLNSAFALLEN